MSLRTLPHGFSRNASSSAPYFCDLVADILARSTGQRADSVPSLILCSET